MAVPAHVAVGRAYDARADEYVAAFGTLDQLADADRALVTRWRDETRGPLLDAGCGPGTWSGLLAEGGRPAVGLDASAGLLAHARPAYPDVAFVRGSLSALPLRDATVGGVLAWYSTIHTPPPALSAVLAELARVLAPDGQLVLGFFEGEPAEPFDHAVTTAYFWSHAALRPLLGATGLEVVEEHRRREPGARPLAALVARRAGRTTPRT